MDEEISSVLTWSNSFNSRGAPSLVGAGKYHLWYALCVALRFKLSLIFNVALPNDRV